MEFLTGKTALITGAGRAVLQDGSCGSIGYGIATAYAKEGANLVITGRNVKKLEEAKDELERLYSIKVLPVLADVCAGGDNEATVQNVVKQAVETFGGIQVLINNAQASASGVPLADNTTEQFDSHRACRGNAPPSAVADRAALHKRGPTPNPATGKRNKLELVVLENYRVKRMLTSPLLSRLTTSFSDKSILPRRVYAHELEP